MSCSAITLLAPRFLCSAMLLGLLSAFLGWGQSAAASDVFDLKSGGQVRGVWLNRKDPDRKNYLIRTEFGGEVTLDKSEVAKIDPQSTTEFEYEKLRPTYPDTVEGHLKLALWCRENSLARQRRTHLNRVLELDPDHESTRKSLGYRKVMNRWMTRDEEMASRGMIKYNGQYRTSQEIEILKKEKKQTVAEKAWFKKLKTWRGWLNKPGRSQQAQLNITRIRSPVAVKAIAFYLRGESDPRVRLLYLEALSNINSSGATSLLVSSSLGDKEEEVRMSALDYVVRSKREGVENRYLAALTSKSNLRVNRAAIALRELGDQNAIPSLIDALVTNHTYKTAGRNPNEMSSTFGKGGGGGFSMGGSPPKTVHKQLRNPEVLAALIEMTRVNYEYNQPAWKAWYAQQIRTNRLDARRD